MFYKIIIMDYLMKEHKIIIIKIQMLLKEWIKNNYMKIKNN